MLTDCYEQLWAPLQEPHRFFLFMHKWFLYFIRFFMICLHFRNQIYSQTLPVILYKVLSLFPASILLEHGLTREISNQLIVAYLSYLTAFRTLWWMLSGLGNVSSFRYSKYPFTAVTRYPWISQLLLVSARPFWLMHIHTSIFLCVIWQLLVWNLNSASPAAV